MRKTIFVLVCLSALSLFAFNNCGKGSQGQNNNTSNSITGPTPTPQPPVSTPIDYSNKSCGSVADCSMACDYKYPFARSTELQYYCNRYSGRPDTCQIYYDWHDETYLVSNQYCKSLPTTQIINPANIGTKLCGADSNCVQICNQIQPTSDRAIENYYSSVGGTTGGAITKAMIRNQVAREQLKACLATAAQIVYDIILAHP